MAKNLTQYTRTASQETRSLIRRYLARRLKRIPGIQPEDIRKLRGAGILDSEELVSRFEDGSLAALSTATTLTQRRLAELIDGTSQLSWNRIGSRAQRHVFDFTIAILAAGLILSLFPSLRKRLFPPEELTKSPAVTAARDIPVYGTIDSDDLKVDNERDPKKWPSLLAPFRGKLATTAIRRGSAITADQVTKAPFRLGGRSVLKASVKSLPSLEGRLLPQMVEVIFSPRANPDAGAVIPAVLLAIDSSGTPAVATLGVSVTDLPQVSRWIGSSDAYVTLRVP